MIKNRDLYNQLLQHLDKKEYSIIIGARQVCKTTLIQQMYSELKKSFSDSKFRLKSYKKFQQFYPSYSLKCISYLSSGNSIPILKI